MAKPAVDGIEGTLAEQDLAVIRLNAMNGLGRALIGRYAVRGVPTLIVVDGAGQPVLRQVGRVDRDAVVRIVDELHTEPVQ